MRYPQSHKQAVRARILEAAAEELRRHGLSGIGIPALMRRAGLTHGAFYAHFPSRESLVAEAIRAAAAASADCRKLAEKAKISPAVVSAAARAAIDPAQ